MIFAEAFIMGADISNEDIEAIGAKVADIDGDGAPTFHDFVEKYGYQYGPHYSRESLQQNLQFAHGGDQHESAYALSVAKNIAGNDSDVRINSVALNPTVNAAIVALAEQDMNDLSKGHMHYIAFVQGRDPRTYIFTENIIINADGTIESQMEQGYGRDMSDIDERAAYQNLTEKFGDVSQKIDDEKFRRGEYKVEHTNNTASVSSVARLNATTAIELVSEYSRSGKGGVLMKVFRESAEGVTETVQGMAAAPDNKAKYSSFSQMQPGIHTMAP